MVWNKSKNSKMNKSQNYKFSSSSFLFNINRSKIISTKLYDTLWLFPLAFFYSFEFFSSQYESWIGIFLYKIQSSIKLLKNLQTLKVSFLTVIIDCFFNNSIQFLNFKMFLFHTKLCVLLLRKKERVSGPL